MVVSWLCALATPVLARREGIHKFLSYSLSILTSLPKCLLSLLEWICHKYADISGVIIWNFTSGVRFLTCLSDTEAAKGPTWVCTRSSAYIYIIAFSFVLLLCSCVWEWADLWFLCRWFRVFCLEAFLVQLHFVDFCLIILYVTLSYFVLII